MAIPIGSKVRIVKLKVKSKNGKVFDRGVVESDWVGKGGELEYKVRFNSRLSTWIKEKFLRITI